jgi:hypothetical protein
VQENVTRSSDTEADSACRLLSSASSQKGSIRRHEAGQHRRNQFRRFDGLAGFSAEHLGVSNKITMDRRWQFDAEFRRLVVWNGGKLQPVHRIQSQL